LKDTLEVYLGVETPFSAAQKAHPGIATDGLHTLAEKLQKHGYSVQWDRSVPIWARSIPDRDRFFTTDPVGNRIEFLGDT
jgi:extradiol dioxygenase family protein